MAKPSKIEALKLQADVARLVAEGKSARAIAPILSKKAKTKISHMAVDRYLKSLEAYREETGGEPEDKEAVMRRRPALVEQAVERDLDVINLQYKLTSVLVDRFDSIVGAPDMFERRMDALVEHMKANGMDPDHLHNWRAAFLDDMRRNVIQITALNRELRENSKFLVDLREKAFTFNLVKEFMDNFMEIFQRKSPEAFDLAMAEVAANPRLQRIVEQQLRGVAG